MQRPGWYDLQGAGSAPRDKRCLDASEGDDLHPEAKRPKVPALASVIVEALKVDSLQKICSSLEPILRRVEVFLGNINIIPNLNFQANFAMFMIDVSEEVERALAKLGPARVGGRSSPKRIEGPDGRNLQLQFRTRLSPHIFTGGKVEGEQGAPIHVVLLDVNSGHVVSSGTESSAKLDVLVLQGDFNNEDDENWTEEEFESHVVKEREGKRPLLTGDLQVSLKDGVGTLGELTFTDNSSWIRSRKFRLGLKIASGYCEGVRIREAKSEAFTVKDHRGELYKKHYPPALKDEVWRLEKIGKDGSFHKRLNKCGIHTVEDFLRLVVRDPQRLRNILGSGMSNKMWEILVEHAKTCVLSGKYYIYYSDETRNVGAIFNNIYEFSGLIGSGQFYSADDLNDSQKAFADTLVKKAYDNWSHAIEYDGRALLNFTNNKKAVGSQKDTTLTSDYPSSYDEHVSQLHSQDSAPVEEHVVETEEEAGGGTIYNSNQTARYSNLIHDVDSSARLPIGSTSFAPENQLVGSAHQTQITRNDSTGLALAPPQQASLEYHSSGPSVQHQDLGTFDDWSRQRDNRSIDDFFSEDEIRMRSNEMLENDDMQHLLRVFTMGGTSTSLHDDGFGFSSYMHSPCPNFNFDDDRNRGSGKAVIGWLKIKAAMRWGIFVRKRAAERRRAAQLVELDD